MGEGNAKMTRQEMLSEIVNLMISDLELLGRKNRDYSPNEDALENFRDFGAAGIIVRLGDKYKRAKTWAKRGNLEISGEGIDDTLRDMSNYCYLARAMLREEK